MTLDHLRDSWDEWGRRDPMWVILSAPGKQDGQWSPEEFFATGRREVASLLQKLAELGIDVPRRRALDFGCGVGRVTQALCEHFDECTGVDIAQSMIDGAEQYNRFGERCRYVVNTADDLGLFPSDHFDLVYCKLVLQHMEPELGRAYVGELARVLSPDGVLVFQIPSEVIASGRRSSGVDGVGWRERVRAALSRPRRGATTSDHGAESDRAPNVVMHGTPRAEVLRIVEESGARPITVEEDRLAGDAWRSYTYYVTKDRSAA